MARRIELDAATKKGIALAIGALCVCVVGAILVVGRGSGSTGLEPAQVGPGPGANRPDGYGGAGPWGPGAPGTDDDALSQFRACLGDRGVTLPEPGQGRRIAPDDDLRAAFEACRRYLPDLRRGPNGSWPDHGVPGRGDDSRGSSDDSTL